MISFGFKDFYAGNGFDKCLEAGTAFRGLTNTISHIETFFLAGAEASRRCGGTYFPAAISFCRSSSSNWAGVMCRTTGGGDEGANESEDEDLKGDIEGDGGGSW